MNNKNGFEFPGSDASGRGQHGLVRRGNPEADSQLSVRSGNPNAPQVRPVQEIAFVDEAKNEIGSVKPQADAFGKPVHRTGRAPSKSISAGSGKGDKTPKKKKKLKKVLIAIASVVLVLVALCLGVAFYFLGKIHTIDENEAPVTIVDENGNTVRIRDITQPTQHEFISEEHIHNFLLIGVDARSTNQESWGNSDVNVVMSIDTQAGTIKMISIARDCYAHIPGYRDQKINAAMSIGGPELLQATIEGCLRIEIDGYAFVNFYNLAEVIDSVGGVVVNVSQTEATANHGLNMCLDELGYSNEHVTSYGDVWLNGHQAVAYGRIRYVGNGDYERSERQVEVLRSLLDRFMDLSAMDKLGAVDDILEMVSTNIPKTELVGYVVDFLPSLDDPTIQYLQLPIVDPNDQYNSCFNIHSQGEWSIRPNWNAEIPFVQEFFYGEQTVFDEVPEIAESPALSECPTPDTLPVESLLR